MRKEITAIYHASKTGREFVANLHKAGYDLSKGKNGSSVLVDKTGDIHGLLRRIEGVKLKDLRQKFPDLKDIQLPSLASALKERRPVSTATFNKKIGKSRRNNKYIRDEKSGTKVFAASSRSKPLASIKTSVSRPARTDGHLRDGEIYLRNFEWIFAPTIPALVKAVTRWDELKITPKWYNWRKEKPDECEWALADRDLDRKISLKEGKWTEDDERNYQKFAPTFEGWWILENLPQVTSDDLAHNFNDWIGDWSELISNPDLAPEFVEEFFQNEFFKSWKWGAGADGDIDFYDSNDMDEVVQYWKTERDEGSGYYGDENEKKSA